MWKRDKARVMREVRVIECWNHSDNYVEEWPAQNGVCGNFLTPAWENQPTMRFTHILSKTITPELWSFLVRGNPTT